MFGIRQSRGTPKYWPIAWLTMQGTGRVVLGCSCFYGNRRDIQDDVAEDNKGSHQSFLYY